jgi:T5SS/PEP-CTERM-associated repeat protein/autotransporter-associated beta strand protein
LEPLHSPASVRNGHLPRRQRFRGEPGWRPLFVGTLNDFGGGYTFLGGTLVFGGSATINALSNNTNFLNGIGLEANATINTLAPNSTLTVSGTVSGGGASLTKTGQGTLILTTAAATFGGDINVNGGTMTIQGTSTVSSVLGNTTVNFGGTLTVEGNSTLSSANGNTNVNGGTITIQGASTVSDANGAIAGAGGPLAGTVIVTGASSWTNSSPVPNSGNLDVGQSGTGTLSIQNFSRVSNTGIGIIGDASGSTGSVTVTDFGSTWTSGSQIEVGSFGRGTLTIQNGGRVSDSVGAVGLHSGSNRPVPRIRPSPCQQIRIRVICRLSSPRCGLPRSRFSGGDMVCSKPIR